MISSFLGGSVVSLIIYIADWSARIKTEGATQSFNIYDLSDFLILIL
jgi:hypothetical protein